MTAAPIALSMLLLGADVRFTVKSDRDRTPISPLIYGANGVHDPAKNRFGVLRLGGNRYTAYNWENNASNAGSDWHFQNDAYLSRSDEPGAVVRRLVEQAQAIDAAAIVTIPIVDYVAADKNEDGDVRKTRNHLVERFRRNRAEKEKGAPLAGDPDLGDGAVHQDEFVAWLKRTASKTQVLLSLDNEPDLWSTTHPQVHPDPVGYDELCSRHIAYAKMVKRVWPTAAVLGPVSFGWTGFRTLHGAPDRRGKGEFLDYWLTKMQAAGKKEGRRLVDYLDVHWYPEAKARGVRITEAAQTAEVVHARVQAPRSLWDPTYVEESWITEELAGPIRLIPRMKAKIAAHHPGLGLAITEWNYGAGGHISGAVATADVLGIFGREGVALATFFDLTDDESYAFAAFRAFRNFDGKQGRFGDTSIFASTSDPISTSIYASVDAANPARMVLVAINKSAGSKRASLALAHPTGFTRLKTHRLTAAAPELVAGPEVVTLEAGSFVLELPPMSVSVLVPSR